METIPTARQNENDELVKPQENEHHHCHQDEKKVDFLSSLKNEEDYFVVDDVIREVSKEQSFWIGFKKYAFLMWDGLGFWGTDVTKLDRLKRGKYHKHPGWLDRYKSFQYLITTFIIIIIVGSII